MGCCCGSAVAHLLATQHFCLFRTRKRAPASQLLPVLPYLAEEQTASIPASASSPQLACELQTEGSLGDIVTENSRQKISISPIKIRQAIGIKAQAWVGIGDRIGIGPGSNYIEGPKLGIGPGSMYRARDRIRIEILRIVPSLVYTVNVYVWNFL